jgi:hypothetical protein
MADNPRKSNLMGLQQGPVYIGSFDERASRNPPGIGPPKVDPKLLEEAVSHIKRVSELLPPGERADYMRLAVGMFSRISIVSALEASKKSPDGAGRNVSSATPELAVQTSSTQHTVPVDSVIRGGSYFTAAISIMSLVATAMSNVIIIQPFIALLFLIASIGFFCMTLVPHDRTERDS